MPTGIRVKEVASVVVVESFDEVLARIEALTGSRYPLVLTLHEPPALPRGAAAADAAGARRVALYPGSVLVVTELEE